MKLNANAVTCPTALCTRIQVKLKLNYVAKRPPLVGEVVSTFADRGFQEQRDRSLRP
jgi:hypothetical protein